MFQMFIACVPPQARIKTPKEEHPIEFQILAFTHELNERQWM